jgi:chromosomal replication initiation ATPase DnaA
VRRAASHTLPITCKISATTIISLSNGTVSRMHQPDYETRISILKNILYHDGVEIPEEIIDVACIIKSKSRTEGSTHPIAQS